MCKALNWCSVVGMELSKMHFCLLEKYRNAVCRVPGFLPCTVSFNPAIQAESNGLCLSHQHTGYDKIMHRSTIRACSTAASTASTCKKLGSCRIINYISPWLVCVDLALHSQTECAEQTGTTDSSWKWFTSLAGITSLTYKPEVKISH